MTGHTLGSGRLTHMYPPDQTFGGE